MHVLWQFFQWSYSDPSDLLIYDASGNLVTSLQSVQGVKQGDPVSYFLFALTIQSLLEEAVVNLPNMTAVAYLDDVFLVGSGSSVVTAYDRLTQSLPVVGLHVNSQKSSCLWPFLVRKPPPQLHFDLANRGIPLIEGFMEILGAPIGWDDRAIADWCRVRVQENHSFFEQLGSPLISGHHALLLLKSSLRPKLNYLNNDNNN